LPSSIVAETKQIFESPKLNVRSGVLANVRGTAQIGASLTATAKAHVAKLLEMYPTMNIREANAFCKMFCFEPSFREKMVGALRKAGLPE